MKELAVFDFFWPKSMLFPQPRWLRIAGDIESSSALFGDSWKVYSACPRSEEEPVHPCVANPIRADWARFACRILHDNTFAMCHSAVDPEPFYQSCLWDSCGCDRGGDCECMCTAIAAYVRECNENDVHIRWRSTGICGERFAALSLM